MHQLFLMLVILSLFPANLFTQTKRTKKKTAKKPVPVKPVGSNRPTPTPTPKTKPIATPTVGANPSVIISPVSPIQFELKGLEAEVFAEINKMRLNPREYVKNFEAYLLTNNGTEFTEDGVRYTSNEGKVPVQELIATMKQLEQLPEFKVSEGLTKAARDHAQDLAKNNISGHIGSDGSQHFERVAKYGTGNKINENISYFTKTARRIVMTMLIDDGIPSRSHRENMLSKKLTLIGIAIGENKSRGGFCVIVFSDDFVEFKKVELDQVKFTYKLLK